MGGEGAASERLVVKEALAEAKLVRRTFVASLSASGMYVTPGNFWLLGFGA